MMGQTAKAPCMANEIQQVSFNKNRTRVFDVLSTTKLVAVETELGVTVSSFCDHASQGVYYG
jgi:hypothetical protein